MRVPEFDGLLVDLIFRRLDLLDVGLVLAVVISVLRSQREIGFLSEIVVVRAHLRLLLILVVLEVRRDLLLVVRDVVHGLRRDAVGALDACNFKRGLARGRSKYGRVVTAWVCLETNPPVSSVYSFHQTSILKPSGTFCENAGTISTRGGHAGQR